MTVSQLIAELQKLPNDADVIMYDDSDPGATDIFEPFLELDGDGDVVISLGAEYDCEDGPEVEDDEEDDEDAA